MNHFTRVLGLCLATTFGTTVYAAPTTKPELSPGLQAAKRAAYLENSGNLPARGLLMGSRAVQSSQKIAPKTALKTPSQH